MSERYTVHPHPPTQPGTHTQGYKEKVWCFACARACLVIVLTPKSAFASLVPPAHSSCSAACVCVCVSASRVHRCEGPCHTCLRFSFLRASFFLFHICAGRLGVRLCACRSRSFLLFISSPWCLVRPPFSPFPLFLTLALSLALFILHPSISWRRVVSALSLFLIAIDWVSCVHSAKPHRGRRPNLLLSRFAEYIYRYMHLNPSCSVCLLLLLFLLPLFHECLTARVTESVKRTASFPRSRSSVQPVRHPLTSLPCFTICVFLSASGFLTSWTFPSKRLRSGR